MVQLQAEGLRQIYSKGWARMPHVVSQITSAILVHTVDVVSISLWLVNF
jgi:hypothetical protein